MCQTREKDGKNVAYFDRAPNSISCRSIIPAKLIPNCAYSASESVRTSKNTFGIFEDLRIVFIDIPSALGVLNAENPKR